MEAVEINVEEPITFLMSWLWWYQDGVRVDWLTLKRLCLWGSGPTGNFLYVSLFNTVQRYSRKTLSTNIFLFYNVIIQRVAVHKQSQHGSSSQAALVFIDLSGFLHLLHHSGCVYDGQRYFILGHIASNPTVGYMKCLIILVHVSQ